MDPYIEICVWRKNMKSILFVINTMGVGGGAKAILELFKQFDFSKYEVSLFVLTGQGELVTQIPPEVKLLNKKYFPISVLDKAGEMQLLKTVIKSMFTRGTFFKRIGYVLSNLLDMIKKSVIHKDKLCWKILADGAPRMDREYDLAVAYLEGGSAYYVASYVKAKKKAVFIHTNYELAGYTRKLDEDCYLIFDKIFAVSESVKKAFLSFYPECRKRTSIFYNLLDKEEIIRKSKEPGGFTDCYDGLRILTVGRLVPEKAHDVEISAMKILKDAGKPFRWYVLGEGEMRKRLEDQIRRLGLENDFILLGTVENPFPYYFQCDLYVHAAYVEGKCIAIEEAQILGCAMLVSDHAGIREQVDEGVDAEIFELDPNILAESILAFTEHPQKMKKYGCAAAERRQENNQKEISKLLELL